MDTSGFVGRHHELAALDRVLKRVKAGGRAGRPGRAVLIRGRRRVGKSRLVEEFIERSGLPSLYFTASALPSTRADLDMFAQALAASDLPGAAPVDQPLGSWDTAFRLLALAVPQDSPAIVVLDEMPYLIQNDEGFEGTLQKAFDRELSRRPILLLCVGSDLAMMERLNDYDRPFHQRGTELVVPPLNPADIADLLGLPAAEAFDAYLVTGGLPLVLEEFEPGMSLFDHLEDVVTNPVSATLVSAELSLAAEFPTEAQARVVLRAIGSGERTHALISRAAGDMAPSSLSRALRLLIDKRVVEAATPLSVRPSKETRYAVADPYLRFWLAFLGPYLSEIERRRGDLVLDRIRRSWTTWRGRAIEPVVREALFRMREGGLPEGSGAVGGYWTRTNDPEIDIVAADRGPVAKRVTAVGSIKWLERKPFDARDLSRLILHRAQLPGADEDTPLLAVSRSGVATEVGTGVQVVGPDQLLTAWRG
ncbi:ATP-binding protein [Streptomyces sp. NPDC127098]|uniref:ATP-binding protein n=1 Tax=Streptomyces sp. NPDC127098 TaxID=3347137 RepID=UPI0036561A72